MRMNHVWPGALMLVATCSVGCAPTAPKRPQSQVFEMTVKKPVLTPLAETKATQERGGVTLIVEPFLYEVKVDSVIDDRPRNPDFLESLFKEDNAYYFTRYVNPTVAVHPDQLGFNVRLVNGLNHVVRGAGTVVSAVVDGKQVALGQDGYAELVNAVVIPRGELAIRIWGPKLNVLPNSCTFGLFLYDFVTATDAAGNPSERQNFEWYYNYTAAPEYVSGAQRTAKMVRTPEGEHPKK